MAESTNIGTAYITVLPSMEKFGTAVKQGTGNVDLEDAGEKSGNSFGKGFKKTVKAAIVAVGAMTTATTFAAKATLEAYGDYEQLVGGVEKLFGEENSRTIIDNAQNAFRTAGLSANEYMETVTSFSASLISSLGGDTAEAAEIADIAIRDMSDNANVFGSDMASIQAAYQGFAKGQYTLLDNLKLGYGGTKTEMERLIKDANLLKEAQGEMGDLTIESYSDIIEAIHLVQTEMNITGTTAKEAAGTIQGSLGSLKASVKNLWTAFGDPTADIKKQTQEVVDSFKDVVTNIAPVVEQFSEVLPIAISEFTASLPELMPTITGIFNNLVDAGFELAKGLVNALPSLLEEVPTMVSNLLQNIFDLIGSINWGELLGSVVETATGVIGSIFETITRNSSESMQAWYDHRDAINEYIAAGREAFEAAQALNDQRTESYNSIYSEIGLMEDIKGKLIEYTDEQGHVKEGYEDELAALIPLAEKHGIHIDVVDEEVQEYLDLIGAIDNTIEKRKADAISAAETQIYEEAYTKRRELDGQYREHYAKHLEYIAEAQQAKIKGDEDAYYKYSQLAGEELAASEALKDGIVEYSAQMELASHNIAAAASGDFDALATTWADAGIDYEAFYDGLAQTNDEILKDIDATYKAFIPEAIKEGDRVAYAQAETDWRAQQMLTENMAFWTGQNVPSGVADGIRAGEYAAINAAGAMMEKALARAQAVAQIESPSRKGAYFGKMIDYGFAEGIEDNANVVNNAMESMTDSMFDSVDGIANDLNQNAFDVVGENSSVDINSTVNGMLGGALSADISAETAILAQIAGSLGEIVESVKEGKVISLDSGEMIGALKSRINDALGSLMNDQERGVAYV